MVHGIAMTDFHILLEEGKRRARKARRDILVSYVVPVGAANPLAFFSTAGAKFAGNRFFWTDPLKSATFVGLGSVMRSNPKDAGNRFREIERTWREIADDAVVSPDAPLHAGPFFFGGFSFDPLKPGTELWRHYPHTLFVVPEYMLTVIDDGCWLTINRKVSPWEEAASVPDDWESLQALEDAFAASPEITPVLKEEIDPAGWMQSVEEAAQAVRNGELDKIVLARELRVFADRPFAVQDVLARLYAENANSYIFALEQGEHCLIGATPERLVKSEGNRLLSTCLAGSIARGKTDEEDDALGKKLYHDVKNLHEHALTARMIGDTMRRFCDHVETPEGLILYKLKDIQHLYTPVTGEAKEGVTILKLVEELHPTPALGGLPRQQALEWIRRHEPLDRGWYAGPIGWMNRRLDGEFAVAIRSALLRGKEASLFAGCGIVGDSEPISEYNETALKFRPMLSALGALDSAE